GKGGISTPTATGKHWGEPQERFWASIHETAPSIIRFVRVLATPQTCIARRPPTIPACPYPTLVEYTSLPGVKPGARHDILHVMPGGIDCAVLSRRSATKFSKHSAKCPGMRSAA